MRYRLLLPLIALLGAGTAVPHALLACSTDPYVSVRGVRLSFFVATALPDTVLTGPGAMIYYPDTPRPEMPVEAPPRAIFGQVVRIQRYAGPDEDRIGRALQQVHGEAIVVPWSDRADCRPALWRGSFRWVESGSDGFYIAHLRPAEQWIDGRPTLDVRRAWAAPYTVATARAEQEGKGREVLTPMQYLSLVLALPVWDPETQRTLADGSWMQWETSHPELAQRYPAAEILRRVRGHGS